jgi:hypothetical protein
MHTALLEAEIAPAERPRTSDILLGLAATHPGPLISLGDVVAALGRRGLGVLAVALALPNLLPGPVMPGYSTVFGLPLAVIAWRNLVAGGASPVPDWLQRRAVSHARFARFARAAAPWLRRLERWLRPSASWLTRSGARPLLATTLLCTALLLAAPIPFGPVLPAIALVFLGLGLVEEDSRALALGIVLAVVSAAWIAVLVLAGAQLWAFAQRWL